MRENGLFGGRGEKMRRRKGVAKATLFVVVFICIFGYFTRILTPDYFYNQTWASSCTHNGFYQMKKNTVDVLFIGPSTSGAGFIPQELYNGYGIVSYNLSEGSQSTFTSYYWLKEALKFQKPKVIVLEMDRIFKYSNANDEIFNCGEGVLTQ